MITVIGDTLTVEDLINKLKEYPKDMPLCTDGFTNIVDVKLHTWQHSNHPYNLPDTDFLMII